MVDFLLESGRRTTRASIVQAMMTKTNAKYEADLRTMGAVVDESESRLLSTLTMSSLTNPRSL